MKFGHFFISKLTKNKGFTISVQSVQRKKKKIFKHIYAIFYRAFKYIGVRYNSFQKIMDILDTLAILLKNELKSNKKVSK